MAQKEVRTNMKVLNVAFFDLQKVMLDNKYLKPPFNYKAMQVLFGNRFLGNGLVSETDHERWSNHRRVFNPAFHRK